MNLHEIKSQNEDLEAMLAYLGKLWDNEYELEVREDRQIWERNRNVNIWTYWSPGDWKTFTEEYHIQTGIKVTR